MTHNLCTTIPVLSTPRSDLTIEDVKLWMLHSALSTSSLAPPNSFKPLQSLSRPWNDTLFKDGTVTMDRSGGHRLMIFFLCVFLSISLKILNQNDFRGREMSLGYAYVSICGHHPVLCSFEVLQHPCHTNAGIIAVISGFTASTLRNRGEIVVHRSDGSPIRSFNVQGT